MTSRRTTFWSPHKGEMIYSLLVRQYLRDWRPTFGVFLRSCFGVKSDFLVRSNFLGNIQSLCERMPDGHPLADLESISSRYSILPLLTLFETAEFRREAEKRWFGNRLHSLRTLFWLQHCRFELQPSELRYCPECVRSDRLHVVPPLPYWRIIHQLPTVFVCHEHGCRLVNGCRDCGGPKWAELTAILPGTCECGETKKYRQAEPPFRASLKQLTELARWTSDGLQSESLVEAVSAFRTFWYALKAALPPDKRGALDRKATYRLMERKYGVPCLEHFGIQMLDGRENSQTTGFKMHGSKGALAFSRLIVISALFPSLDEFKRALKAERAVQDTEVTSAPRSRGFKIAEKNLAAAFKRNNGSAIAVSRELGLTPMAVSLAAYRVGIKKPGETRISIALQSKVVMALSRGEDKKDIAEKLSLSYSTVDRMCSITPGLQQEWERKVRQNLQDLHRSVCLRSLAERKPVPASTSDWLHRNDRAWLKEHRNPVVRLLRTKHAENARKAPRPTFRKAEWRERDTALAGWIETRGREWQKKPPDFRRTYSTLLQGHPHRHLFMQRGRDLPKSRAIAKKCVETLDDYNRRKIDAAKAGMNLVEVPTLSKREFSRRSGLHESVVRRHWAYICGSRVRSGRDPRSARR